MEIVRKQVVEISLTANDVDSAVMQFICACHPEFARGFAINITGAQPLIAEAILAQAYAERAVNHIGTAGGQGFGVGSCPGPLPEGMTGMLDCDDPTSDTYGNYVYSDGSVMVWIPAFYYKIYSDQIVDVQPFARFAGVDAANNAGYALHRAFYDGGEVQSGVFVDKFLCSNNDGIASSVKNGNPLSTYSSHNPINDLNGNPDNAYYGTIEAAKTRGSDFFVNTRFIFSALALLSLAHAQASQDATFCGWHHSGYNFPKGCNNNALGDTNDAALVFVSDGSAYPNCSKTGSANLFARTTHNGQNCGIADLNGCMWEITPGITSDGKKLYVLNTDVSMKNVTGGVSVQTDLWGPKGIKNNYDVLDSSELPAGYSKFGSTLNALSGDQEGTGWELTGLGIALPGGKNNSLLAGGFWNYPDKSLCPISGGDWSYGSLAGFWAFYLYSVRGNSSSSVGFRSALYL